MAKKSKIAKYQKQQALIERYAEKRYELKQAGDIEGLRKLPKDSNPNRLNRRDEIDGRPRGVMRKFGMSRIKFRELAHQGLIPGVQKASWQKRRTVNETRFSNGLSSNEEPKHQNKKESVKANPRSKTIKEKITNVNSACSEWKGEEHLS